MQQFTKRLCPTTETKKKEKLMDEAIFIPITMFIAMAFVIYFFIITRHRERMLLLEKDVNVEDLKSLYTRSKSRYNMAKWALIFLFGGAGLFLGIWINEMTREDGYAPATVLLFIGLGLLVWQRLYGNKQADES